MIQAEEFLKEEENKPVFYHIYGYYDKLLDRYNKPFVEEMEPFICLEQVKASVIKDVKNQFKFKDLCFVYFGKFDLKSAVFELEKEAICLLDLDKIIVKQEDVVDG